MNIFFTGLMISLLMLTLLRPSKPPHLAMLAVLVSLAFTLSIVWLNIIANEVVGVLTALGLLLNIKTGYSLMHGHLQVGMNSLVQL